ncbi:MAG TPA: neutral/alkaline non-lysosomal ceramidase N-terminal domain-containing protein [Alcanivoracaceae bacterium]|nr:neutral/alkaline non-lysosomal ceramidase N-terminal domain-containing protein [Alcanivoracaceae bacterium]
MYVAGWSKKELAIEPRGYAMHGYGNPNHRAYDVRNPLQARTFYIAEQEGAPLIYTCLDLGYVTYAMREGVVAALQKEWGDSWDETRLVLTCTHTHSGPGGCANEAMYNLVTPGFRQDQVDIIVATTVASILAAKAAAAPTELFFSSAAIADEVPVAWNRSLDAYNRNPDVTRYSELETHLALDRTMHLIEFRRAGKVEALLSLFGVHATCLGSSLSNHDGDNKGYAALYAEQALAAEGAEAPVAIFAQGTCGDVSPHYIGPGDIKRRKALTGEKEYAYAQENGRKQSDHALAMMAKDTALPITGALDGVLTYVDMGDQHASPEFANGRDNAFTTPPCHGVSFFRGTRVDGPGMHSFLGKGAAFLARRAKRRRLNSSNPAVREYYQKLYASQGPKDIVMEDERKRVLDSRLTKVPMPGFVDPLVAEIKRQASAGALNKSPLVPSVLPLQMVRLGNITLTCAPGEFTTVAGRRLLAAIAKQLPTDENERHVICTYCNEYMGYVTTYEEYQEQAYEGGHTVYGQWTLAAFQTCYSALAKALNAPVEERQYDQQTRPPAVPVEELRARSNLAPRK